MFCKNCGTKMNDNELFCPNCGTKQDNVATSIPQEEPKKYKKPHKVNKKVIAAIAAVMAVVLVFAFVVVPIANRILHPPKEGFVSYLKDDELYINYLDGFNSQQLSKKLILNGFDSSNFENAIYYASVGMKYYPKLNRVFFPDRIEEVDSEDGGYKDKGISLYYADLNKKDETVNAVKIDSSMLLGYVISEDGEKVYYQNVKGDLFISDLQTNTRLAENVSRYFVNEDKNIITYYTYETTGEKYDLYTVVPGESAKKVVGGIESIRYTSDDGNVICFSSNNKLYVTVNGSAPKEIVSYGEDLWVSVYYADKDGHVVYTQSSDKKLFTKSYVDDDLAASDNNIEYPSYFDDDYYEKREKYDAKQDRDRIRDYLTDDEIISCYDLFYYDGSKTEKIAEYVDDVRLLDDNLVLFDYYEIKSSDKLKFSEVYNAISDSSIYDFREYVRGKVFGEKKVNLLIEKTINSISQQIPVSDFYRGLYTLSKDKSDLYYLADFVEDETSGNLYKATISGSKLGEAKKLCGDVCSFFINGSGQLITYRDPIETDEDVYSADLYIDDKKIDTGVTAGYTYTNGYKIMPTLMYTEDGTLYYITSYTKNGIGTLKQYDGKTTAIVASDIIGYYPISKDFVYYISSYSSDSGELYLKNGEETIKIASGVSSVFKAVENTDK